MNNANEWKTETDQTKEKISIFIFNFIRINMDIWWYGDQIIYTTPHRKRNIYVWVKKIHKEKEREPKWNIFMQIEKKSNKIQKYNFLFFFVLNRHFVFVEKKYIPNLISHRKRIKFNITPTKELFGDSHSIILWLCCT